MILGLMYCTDFVTEQESASLIKEIDQQDWITDLSRRVQHYGYRYSYRDRKIDESMRVEPIPEFATFISEKLVKYKLFSRMPDQLIINEYLPGQGISPHIDCVPCFKSEIATVSLGIRVRWL